MPYFFSIVKGHYQAAGDALGALGFLGVLCRCKGFIRSLALRAGRLLGVRGRIGGRRRLVSFRRDAAGAGWVCLMVLRGRVHVVARVPGVRLPSVVCDAGAGGGCYGVHT